MRRAFREAADLVSGTNEVMPMVQAVGLRVVGSLFLVVGVLGLGSAAVDAVTATRVGGAVVTQVRPPRSDAENVRVVVRTRDGHTLVADTASQDPSDYRVGERVGLLLHHGDPAEVDQGWSAFTGDFVAAGAGLFAWVFSFVLANPEWGKARDPGPDTTAGTEVNA